MKFCQEPYTKEYDVSGSLTQQKSLIFVPSKIINFWGDQDLFLLHQESMILECHQDLKNLEVSHIK